MLQSSGTWAVLLLVGIHHPGERTVYDTFPDPAFLQLCPALLNTMSYKSTYQLGITGARKQGRVLPDAMGWALGQM